MRQERHESPFGSLILIADQGKLLYCNWDTEDCAHKLTKILKQGSSITSYQDLEILRSAGRQLDEYFSNSRKTFDIPVGFTGTNFQKQVWRALQDVGYASTVTYKKLASLIGSPKGSRAVAQACGANPLAIFIPCHRVISSAAYQFLPSVFRESQVLKHIGGYTGGVDKKISLLSLEFSSSLP